jgi:amino acid adenylation domain-containing protein
LILGAQGDLVPVGAVGELYIGGSPLARGYVGRPRLTAEKFVADPFNKGQRLYKTGDLARWLPDGNIRFLGRIDHQVQIRGLRIEPGEVESYLVGYERIKKAVVIAQSDNDGETYLCAFVVSSERLVLSALRTYLTQQLPQYMVPALFVQLEKMPLTPSGKLNRALLESLDIESVRGPGIKAPKNETEKKLADIWSGVLGVEKTSIGTDKNFFELGGHSLKATVLMSKIHKAFDIKISLREFFEDPSVAGLAEYIKRKGKRTEKTRFSAIENAPEKKYYNLSPSQNRLYILQRMDPQNTAYNVPLILGLEEKPRMDKFRSALSRLIQRHESLRTSFQVVENHPVQDVRPPMDIDIEYYHIPPGEVPPVVRDFVRPFDLSLAPLLRVGLIESSDGTHILMTDMHHIISDGVSQGLLLSDFIALYSGRELSPLKLQYKDYSEWQNRQKQMEGSGFKAMEAYWLKQFEDDMPVLQLPVDYPRPPVQSFEGAAVHFQLERQYSGALKELASGVGATLFMVILAIYNILLAKLSGQEDITVGAAVAGRNHADLEKIIGMFVNVLALRNYPVGEKSFNEFLRDVKARTLHAYDHQDYPFEDLVDQVMEARDLSRNPVYSAGFTLNNLDGGNEDTGYQKNEELKTKPFEYDMTVSKIDLNLLGFEGNEQLFFRLEYCTRLFQKETVERFTGYFKTLIKEIIAHPTHGIDQLELISDDEKKKLLFDFNVAHGDECEPADATLHGLFEEQVSKTPGNIAVTGEDGELTYMELNQKVHRLAGRIRNLNLEKGSIVALMMENSVTLAASILAVLKAGCVYLPLDPPGPIERKKMIIRGSGCRLLIIQRHLREGHEENRSLPVDEFLVAEDDAAAGEPASNWGAVEPADPACLIYTSGTMGRPKGVLVEHRGLVNYSRWRQRTYRYSREDVSLQPLSYCFDGFGSNFYTSLLSGGALVMLHDSKKLDMPHIARLVNTHKVTNISFVPGMFQMLLEHAEKDQLASLRFVVLAGDRSSPALVEKCREKIPHLQLINEYGPTETTVTAAANCGIQPSNTSLIGKPISNTRLYILDPALKPVPLKVNGELYISGRGVTRGYLNDPLMTAERFIENPWAPGETMYRTGDLARWLPDGTIELSGRIDHQVKIRGNRVEPEEIAHRLLEHENIEEAVVMVREVTRSTEVETARRNYGDEDSLYLCAYFVSGTSLATPELRRFLADRLPEYMIPAVFIPVEAIPLTSNGKINRRALEAHDTTVNTGMEYVAPRNRTENLVAETWKNLLNIEKIGIDDNFFDLGGNSTNIIQLNSRLKEVLKHDIPIIVMFEYPTIRSFLQYLDRVSSDREDEDLRQYDALQEESIDMMEQTLQIIGGDGNE